ncbi:MAG: SMP-30/gluconolactonase/LRE family protein [Acidimicrobiia bacterium]
MDGPAILCAGPRFGEGPVWCPPDRAHPEGSLVCTSVSDGTLHRVDLATGTRSLLADTGGGANSAAPASDGGFVVTQNGGLDFSVFGDFFAPAPPPVPTIPSGLQHVAADGTVATLLAGQSHAPNDLVVGPDGTVYFTDPPHWPVPDEPVGRVMAWSATAGLRTVADGLHFPNGIALDVDGETLIVAENGRHMQGQCLLRIRPDGSQERFAEGRTVDGFALDVDGRIYAAGGGHIVTILEPDGTPIEVLESPGDHPVSTNCCLGGVDGRTLFAVDAGSPGHVYCWSGLPAPGLPLNPWPGP